MFYITIHQIKNNDIKVYVEIVYAAYFLCYASYISRLRELYQMKCSFIFTVFQIILYHVILCCVVFLAFRKILEVCHYRDFCPNLHFISNLDFCRKLYVSGNLDVETGALVTANNVLVLSGVRRGGQ